VVIYWTALWRKSIPWTPRRRRAPKVAGGIGIVIGAIGYFSFDLFGIDEVNLVLLGILIPSLWLIATIIYWRETLAERAARLGRTGRANISCPTCGYNLTGLSEARCPECGSKFTLDELVARQPGAAAGEIE
jgi:DNA-directed RNA polymerase subunit RPC12/RpoP